MIRNYIITSYRFIVKSKTYTILNLTGLVAGLTASFILLIFTINELSYDRFHPKAERICRVLARDLKGNWYALSPYDVGPVMKKELKGIETVARLALPAYLTGTVMVNSSGVYVEERSFFCADKELLSILDIELLSGNPALCLSDPESVIISEEASRKHFNGRDPVGKELTIKTSGVIQRLKVTGVFRSLPWNSTLEMDFIANISVFPAILSNFFDSTELSRQLAIEATIETFLLLKPENSIGEVSALLPDFIRRTAPDTGKTYYDLQQLSDIYLGSADVSDMVHKKGNRSNMYIYLALALFVLLLAGINYSILSTARSALRYKEIGVRKVMGATRRALSGQVLTESVLLTFLSFPISYLLIGISEPALQWVFGYRVEVYSAGTLVLLPLFAGITIFIGLISGAYIAFYLSALNPMEALKNKLASHRRINLSRVFIIFQLLITLSLFIAVIVITLQVRFCLDNDLGINRKNLSIVRIDLSEFNHYEEFKKDVASIPGVTSVSGTSIMVPDIAVITIPVKLSKEGEAIKLEIISVDTGFFEAIGVPFISGSDFEPPDSSRSYNAKIINEEAARVLDLSSKGTPSFGGSLVIGTVRNFNLHTMYDSILPIVFQYRPGTYRTMVIRYSEGTRDTVAARTAEYWNKYAPHLTLDFRDVSDELGNLYKKEQTFGYVVGGFAVLAFIIMGMGLFGLALLISERKTKETAIRKVFGATNRDILFGMQKEFLLYSAIASVIAIPVTWYSLSRWLNTFYYRISLDWWIFAISAAFITLFVSSIIFARTLRVLRENPIKALKYE